MRVLGWAGARLATALLLPIRLDGGLASAPWSLVLLPLCRRPPQKSSRGPSPASVAPARRATEQTGTGAPSRPTTAAPPS